MESLSALGKSLSVWILGEITRVLYVRNWPSDS